MYIFYAHDQMIIMYLINLTQTKCEVMTCFTFITKNKRVKMRHGIWTMIDFMCHYDGWWYVSLSIELLMLMRMRMSLSLSLRLLFRLVKIYRFILGCFHVWGSDWDVNLCVWHHIWHVRSHHVMLNMMMRIQRVALRPCLKGSITWIWYMTLSHASWISSIWTCPLRKWTIHCRRQVPGHVYLIINNQYVMM